MKSSVSKVLIIEDHPAMGQGTRVILEQMEMISVVGIAETGRKGFEMISHFCPNIIILDLNLPDIYGKDLIKEIKGSFPDVDIIAFTGYDYIPLINILIENGVSGILSKSASVFQVKRMVESVVNGETIVPLNIFEKLRVVEELGNIEEKIWTNKISKKEKDILAMVSCGFTNKQISTEMSVSVRTVECYLTKIFEKMKVSSRSEAVKVYMEKLH
jgi:two-component system, NarL family, competent response regulator ComA